MINPPYRFDPLQNIVNCGGESSETSCSGGGFIVGSAEISACIVYWNQKGKVGYCFQAFPHTAGNTGVYVFEFTQSMDAGVPNTPAWQAANNYPGDPGAAAAISVWNQFATAAIGVFSPFVDDLDTLDPVPGFGPYSQNVGSTPVGCNHTDPATGITTGPIGASPPSINGGKGFKDKNFCKGDIF